MRVNALRNRDPTISPHIVLMFVFVFVHSGYANVKYRTVKPRYRLRDSPPVPIVCPESFFLYG